MFGLYGLITISTKVILVHVNNWYDADQVSAADQSLMDPSLPTVLVVFGSLTVLTSSEKRHLAPPCGLSYDERW